MKKLTDEEILDAWRAGDLRVVSAKGSPEWEIVDHNEVGIGDEEPRERQETETHHADGTQKLDAFGAPIKAPVKVTEGVRDSRRR